MLARLIMLSLSGLIEPCWRRAAALISVFNLRTRAQLAVTIRDLHDSVLSAA
jgi:hypothetical protein